MRQIRQIGMLFVEQCPNTNNNVSGLCVHASEETLRPWRGLGMKQVAAETSLDSLCSVVLRKLMNRLARYRDGMVETHIHFL